MDDKEVRIDSGLGTSIHNDCNKRLPNGNATYTSRDKSFPDGSHPLGKADTRPCAIIGPDRVLPSADSNDVYMKTIPPEPWEYPDNYRHPYDSIKMSEYHQAHNISPRQTFQENMQRVIVPPTYSSIKSSDETSLKNPKLNVPAEGKYCDVPYSINMLSSEPKSVRSDSAMPAMNHSYLRGVQPHGWTGGVQPLKPYQAHDYYHNTEYSNCPAPRPMPIVQPQRIVHDEIHPMYTDRLYQESNIRFKPYPTSKEKFPQPRYDYSNTFQPPQNPIPKFDIQKSMHGHPYPMYPQGPYKYTVDRRYPEPMMETHPRALYPQHNAFHTHPVHPSYGPLPGNFYHNKPYPCPSDNPKSMQGNKLSYDANNKIYLELENPRYKGYPSPDNFYYNDRAKLMRGDILIPGHTQMNSMGQQHLYKKDNLSIKSIDHSPHYPYRDHRSIGNPLARMPMQFSPNTMSVSMSPCDSNTSNEAVMLGMPQEDCGYVSQSSTTSIRSMDSNNGHADFYRRHGFNYASTNQNAFRKESNSKPASSTDNKKGLNLSQFFQMWNEGDEEDTAANNNNNNQINSNYVSPKPPGNNNQEQLYILGSVTVPQEELSKYEHLQKVSKLPENIKGYNNIEILNQFEQLVESPGMNNLHVKVPPLKEYKVIPQTYVTNQIKDGTQRPVSPLDVEAKISQSVIHKEVGCNFEIKPCSPKVLNVDVAAPVHDVLGERFIEKVANPVMLNLGKDAESKIEVVDKSMNVTSCKMANGKYNQNHVNSAVVKPLYPLQDINANMGVCLASLPQLDSDIDLNLPEVNQQFIDANKIEITSRSPHQIVPMLENDHPDNSYARNNNFSQIHNDGPGPMADQEVTKLSKYRKTKKTDTVNNPILSSSSLAQRTDSVIIKNPENARLCQESQNESLEVVKNIVHKTTQENNNTEIVKNDAWSENNEMAIDFSVNRKEDAKTVNTKSEIDKTNAILSKESQFCPSNMNLYVKENRKTKKSKKSSDSKSIANYFGQQDESFTNYDHNSDSYCTSDEKSITSNKTHEEFIASKELSKMQFEDYQSETSSLTHRELNEPHKKQKLHKEHKTEEIKEEERRLFTDNLVPNRCDDINKLPDLSFELATDSNQQLTPSPLNCNSDRSTDYSKSENIPDADFKNNTNDVQITKLDETSNYSANKRAREVNTSKLVDTIEKELQQMDAKSDAMIDSFSEINHPVTIEANSNVLLQENVSKTNTTLNVSVIKSSDRSCNIKNKEFSNVQESTDIIINENLSESHNKDILESSLFTCNDKDKFISESPISENNLDYKKEFLLDSQLNTKNNEILISENDNTNFNKKLEINTCDNINLENSIVEMNEIDRNFKDCKSPVTESTCDQTMQELNTENNCNQKQQAIENDNNKRDIACELQSNGDHKQSTVYEKLNSAYYKQRVHRKALFSPWVQNLILYNTDNKIVCSDKNKAEADILDHHVRLDENINFAGISDHEKEINNTIENADANKTDCASLSETVDVVQAIHESNNDISENLDNFEEKHDLDEKILCNTSCTEFKQTHPVRCLSPLTFNNNNVKLLKRTSKRSLSDSALISGFQEDESLSTKRSKRNERGVLQPPSIETNLTNILRRNSISEIYNDGKFVILIDKDLILTEESQDTNIYFAEEEITDKYDTDREIIDAIPENLPQYEKELWVDDDDVACTETVFSDDVAEDIVIDTPSSPKGYISSNYETVNKESFMLCEEVIKIDSLIQETEADMLHTNTLNIQQNSDCEDYKDYSCTLSTSNYSSSPEVTSTTSEDKSPGIILKISNHKRSKSSQLDNSKPVIKSNNISYKLTEKKKYKPNVNSSGTLITKAAQKYIPPIKITISDLKVKLPLPKNSLNKLKQLKTSKVEPKKDKKPTKTFSLSAPIESKKPKQKFEDVLMSIDKFQYNYSKVKNKKSRDQIPKVVIKKNETGSHYTSRSSSSSDDTSPDLSGRKWQPWVFIEKNTFIDKMALKHKVKAIYCRRKKSYILSEKFRKYKSVYNAKFVISQPKSDDSNKGNLKYTIRLKHH
ncbi:protein PF14_0175-like isoform X2 [Aricia agestis]|uniref:protein PF14_0175-like isoform X2 n=1 Tax=Aricia agestis TaxID=91739 RepID=UPI001C208453|nr:protein PF14_0175-like isoform X2 [Aricia agestis]